MATIQTIGFQPNFTGKAVTYKGNEYEKTNNGKLIGAGAGAALSAVMVGKGIKNLKSETFQNALKDNFEAIKDTKPDKTLEQFVKTAKKASKIYLGVMTAITVLLGLGIGALVDKNKNENRAFKADMAAKEPAKAE